MTAECRAAEPENGYLKRGTPERAFLETRHIVVSLIRSILQYALLILKRIIDGISVINKINQI